MEPTLNSLVDINTALQVWSKYWPVLKTDPQALKLEKKIGEKVEYRKHVFGTKRADQVVYDPENGTFSQNLVSLAEIEFWKKIQIFSFEEKFRTHFPHVVDISDKKITTLDYRVGNQVP